MRVEIEKGRLECWPPRMIYGTNKPVHPNTIVAILWHDWTITLTPENDEERQATNDLKDDLTPTQQQ